MKLTVLRDFASTTQRFAAGQEIAEGEIPEAERAALIEGGYLAAPKAAKAKPTPAVAAADPLSE